MESFGVFSVRIYCNLFHVYFKNSLLVTCQRLPLYLLRQMCVSRNFSSAAHLPRRHPQTMLKNHCTLTTHLHPVFVFVVSFHSGGDKPAFHMEYCTVVIRIVLAMLSRIVCRYVSLFMKFLPECFPLSLLHESLRYPPVPVHFHFRPPVPPSPLRFDFSSPHCISAKKNLFFFTLEQLFRFFSFNGVNSGVSFFFFFLYKNIRLEKLVGNPGGQSPKCLG